VSSGEPNAQTGRTPSVVVVTVNHRSATLVTHSLEGLAAERDGAVDLRVVVVDNDSGDGSVGVIGAFIEENEWGEWISIVASPTNRGFAAGNNTAIRPLLAGTTRPDYFFLLNPDAYVCPGATATMIDFMDRRPEVGIVGSQLRLPTGDEWPFSFRFPNVLGEFEQGARSATVSRLLQRKKLVVTAPSVATEVDWVAGAAMMIRANVFESAGLMDESYFLYFEETDLCLRARNAGWTVCYLPEAAVVHHFGGSTGRNVNDMFTQPLLPSWFDSRVRYYRKHHGLLYAGLADLARVTGLLLARVTARFRPAPSELDPPSFVTDLVRHDPIVRRLKAMTGRPVNGRAGGSHPG
jgi:N-acetylglucosaminyl-diphospho-decaprenol L-rhamnosyltransferase